MPDRLEQIPGTDRPRALLVEDEPAVRRSLQLLLQAQGFDVRSYATAGALLADPTSGRGACLITDYRLKDLDGIELTRRLKARGWPGLSVLITAFPSDSLIARARDAGMASVLEKPFTEGALLAAVRPCLAGD